MSTMNRLANCKNQYQTEVKRVLCLCSAGLLRSPTAANVLHQEYGYNTRAAGVTEVYAMIPVNEVLLEWADEVLCVSREVYDELLDDWADKLSNKQVVILAIPDQYEWDNEELRDIIKKQYADHFIMAKGAQ